MRPIWMQLGFGLLLCLWLSHSCLFASGSAAAAQNPSQGSGSVLGSLSSYGSVRVGKVAAPRETTLFSGDAVSTDAGQAIAQYAQGGSVLLSSHSAACFSSGQVELWMGKMSLLAVRPDAPVFFALTLRLEPLSAGSAASVSLEGAKASVSVTDGTIRVVDLAGQSLATVPAGHSVVLQTALAAEAGPENPEACPSPAGMMQKKASAAPLWWVMGGVSAAAAAAVVIEEEKSNGTNNTNTPDEGSAVSPSD